MRYFLTNNTLVIRGSFRAAISRQQGGILSVSTILNHTIRHDQGSRSVYKKELELAAAGVGAFRDYTGFVTTIPVQNLFIFRYDFLTVFLTADNRSEGAEKPDSNRITVTICSSEGMSDTALPEGLAVARDAAVSVFTERGMAPVDPFALPLIIACEGSAKHLTAGPETPTGDRIQAALTYGISESLQRTEGQAQARPSFFIYSRFKGEHWVEWTPENCPYYPCHFPGQRCDFCYCPLYPCGDESLGQWATSTNGGRVWNCATCTMIHEPPVTEYLRLHPEASKEELVRVWRVQKKRCR